MPELRHLRAFAAVARERSFTRAGERLHLAQQAVSKSVAQLERELGVALFRRTPRGAELTDAGVALLKDVESLLARADAVVARASAAAAAQTLRLAASPAICAEEVDAFAEAAAATRPRVALSVLDIRPASVAKALSDQMVDLALLRTPPSGAVGCVHTVAMLPAAIALAADHPLARRRSIGWKQLDGERLVVFGPPGEPYRELLVGLAAGSGADLKPMQATVVGGHGLHDVARGRAVAIVPAIRAPHRGICIVPLDADAVLPLTAAWEPRCSPPAVEHIAELASAALHRTIRRGRPAADTDGAPAGR